MEPDSRGFGCLTVTPEFVCFLTILTTFGWDGGLGDHARPPGSRQGTTVCVHTSMDMEQQVRPQTNNAIWDGVISLWSRVAPLLSPWCARGNVPTGVNLNHYDGSRSCVRWHSDNESLFGPPNQPKLIVSLSSGHSVVRRALGDVPSSITLDHGDLLIMDCQRNRSMHIARCLGCRALGLTLQIVGSHNTLRPVHQQAWWVVFSQRVCEVQPSRVPVGWEKGKINGPLLGDWSSFC